MGEVLLQCLAKEIGFPEAAFLGERSETFPHVNGHAEGHARGRSFAQRRAPRTLTSMSLEDLFTQRSRFRLSQSLACDVDILGVQVDIIDCRHLDKAVSQVNLHALDLSDSARHDMDDEEHLLFVSNVDHSNRDHLQHQSRGRPRRPS